MPIHKEVEVCSYRNVSISNKEIVEALDKEDAFEIIKGLLKEYPDLADILLEDSKRREGKIYPDSNKGPLIEKYQEENKTLENFIKSN